MSIFECQACKNEHDDELLHWSTVLGQEICEDCWSSDLDESSTIRIVSTNGDVDTIHVGDFNVTTEYGDDAELPAKREWVSSDGWRGYNSTTIEGWVSVLTGWTTGGWDDAVALRKGLFNQFVDDLMQGNIYTPCLVAVITDSTSNLFSTAITIQVKAGDEETFTEWLNSSEYSHNDLTHSLS